MSQMKPPAPPRVPDIETWGAFPPPEMSARCQWWMQRMRDGWRPNRRVGRMGYYTAAEYYGVYIWEMTHNLNPLLAALHDEDATKENCA